jgi:hypothetical protein
MQRELSQPPRTRDLLASQVKRSLYLSREALRSKVEPDASSSWLYSAGSKKLLFGRESVEVFKIQSGVKIPVRPQDMVVRATPAAVLYAPRGQEKVQVAHSVSLVTGDSQGWARTVKLTNKGDAVMKLRVLTLHDPTSLNYRRDRDPPGEIGVNAFNRHDQVVMDDVGDTTGVRVVGFSPRPSVIYMTKDRARAAELLSLGELPESSLGMSGSVILLTQHDLDLIPGASAEVRSISVYHPSSLESALTAAAPRTVTLDAEGPRTLEFASSSPSMNFAFDWARASLFAMEGEQDLAEWLWSGVALSMVRSDCFERMADSVKRRLKRDATLRLQSSSASSLEGMVVGSSSAAASASVSEGQRQQQQQQQAERFAPTETSLYLLSICSYLSARARDNKKLVKKWYPHIKKVGEGLAKALSPDGLVHSPSGSPDGWRRRLGAGFPTGITAEVNLLALRALRDVSTVAYVAGKGSDSAKFRELSVRSLNALNEKLRDAESGILALNVDSRGVVHKEMTVDQAVGLSYFSPDPNLASSVVHRLLEKDFETGFGPRTIPNSNNLYYSSSYGEGQLGGYWTRAALSHAILAYMNGYPSIGSAQVEKVARLVHLEADRLGGMPGEFPYWMDVEKRQVGAAGSDPVAAARFIEAIIFGEGGLSLGSQGTRFSVPEASQLRWLFLHRLDLGRKGSIFLGRSAIGRAFVVSTFEQDMMTTAAAIGSAAAAGAGGTNSARPGVQGSRIASLSRLPDCERIGGQGATGGGGGGLDGLMFWDASSTLLCLGNTANTLYSGFLSVPSRSKSFSTALFAHTEELRQETGLWSVVERVKLLDRLEVKVELKPNSWKILRLSKPAQ